MTPEQDQQGFVEYRDRLYRVLWAGDTRYGHRAHLQFLDGSNHFWVPAYLVVGSALVDESKWVRPTDGRDGGGPAERAGSRGTKGMSESDSGGQILGDEMKKQREPMTVLELCRRAYMEAFEALRATGLTPALEAREWLERRAFMVASFFAGEEYGDVIREAEPEELDHLLDAIAKVVGGIAGHPDTWGILDRSFYSTDRQHEADKLMVAPPETGAYLPPRRGAEPGVCKNCPNPTSGGNEFCSDDCEEDWVRGQEELPYPSKDE